MNKQQSLQLHRGGNGPQNTYAESWALIRLIKMKFNYKKNDVSKINTINITQVHICALLIASPSLHSWHTYNAEAPSDMRHGSANKRGDNALLSLVGGKFNFKNAKYRYAIKV